MAGPIFGEYISHEICSRGRLPQASMDVEGGCRPNEPSLCPPDDPTICPPVNGVGVWWAFGRDCVGLAEKESQEAISDKAAVEKGAIPVP